MGQSPEERFQSAAKNVVDRARKQQKKTTKQLTKQSDDFLGKNAPQNYAQVAQEIGKASGRSFPKYVRTVEDRFFNTAKEFAEQGRRDLNAFQPGVLEHSGPVTEYLAALGQDFARGVQQVGESGRDRLFALPEQALRAFSASAQNPAFENLANAQYMNFSKNPPTVQTDIATTMRPFITYNV